jgi:hypothetical protein
MFSYLMPIDPFFDIEARRHREGVEETAGDSTTTTATATATTVNG